MGGDFHGATLTLTPVDAETIEVTHGGWASASAAATVDMELGAPPAEHLQEIDPDEAPGMRIGTYLPMLHIDEDGDGLHSGGESIVGVSMEWPVFIAGAIPPKLQAFGLVQGWNALVMDMASDSDLPTFLDPMDLSITADLFETESLSLAGVVETPFSSFDMRMTAVSIMSLKGGGPDAETLTDQVVDNPFTYSFDGPPPESHFISESKFDLRFAQELVLAYQDMDASGDFDSTKDRAVTTICHGRDPVIFMWVDPLTDPMGALWVGIMGIRAGWSAINTNSPGDFVMMLTDAQLLDLRFGFHCDL